MTYVDGFVLPVAKDQVELYRKFAREAGAVWREHGALRYMECVADDVKVGELTSFPRSVQLLPHETVVFAYIEYESREQRDEVIRKVMADPRMEAMQKADPATIPGDMKRMIFGGFETIVEL